MRIGFGCDHAGIDYKKQIVELLQSLGYDVKDFGTYGTESVDYPDFAREVSQAVVDGEVDLGILICGTGIGMSIAANKVKGIRCALCQDTFSAKMSRAHNDANVLALGSRVIGPELAKEIVQAWVTTDFSGGRHQGRLDKIKVLEASGSLE